MPLKSKPPPSGSSRSQCKKKTSQGPLSTPTDPNSAPPITPRPAQATELPGAPDSAAAATQAGPSNTDATPKFVDPSLAILAARACKGDHNFPGTVVIVPADESIQNGKHACRIHAPDSTMSFFLDGSTTFPARLSSAAAAPARRKPVAPGSGAAVVYRADTTKDVWTEVTETLDDIMDSRLAEARALAMGFRTALRQAPKHPDVKTLEFFLDCVVVIEALMNFVEAPEKEEDYLYRQLKHVYDVVGILKALGKEVVVRWAKAHGKKWNMVVGNRNADKAARRARPSPQLNSPAIHTPGAEEPVPQQSNGQDAETSSARDAHDNSASPINRKREEDEGGV